MKMAVLLKTDADREEYAWGGSGGAVGKTEK